METPPIVKTEVMSEDEDSPSKWVNTEGTCILCLTSTAHRVVMPLRRLLRYLQIDLMELYSDTVGNKELDIKVDLCKSCGATQSKLFHLLKKLEQIQADVNDLLEETDIRISKSAENHELMENFSSALTGNEDSPFNFEFFDNIRTMIRKKCMQFFRQPNFDLEEDEDEEVLFSNVIESSEVEDSAAEGIEEKLNTTASSVCEEESTHSSDSENSSEQEEPHRSDRTNKKKEKHAAMSSEQNSKTPVASTSNSQGIEETLNSTASSIGEEEETALSSDSASSEEEPGKSDGINQRKNEKQATMSSAQNSKTPVASTSNGQGIEEMLNSTASSIGEEEETSHSSDTASSDEEPQMSDGINQQKNEKQAAVPSEESSESSVASSDDEQEAQSRERQEGEQPSLNSGSPAEPCRGLRRSKQEAFLEKRSAKTSGQKKTSTSKCQKTLKASKIRQGIDLRKKYTQDLLTGMYKCIKCGKESRAKSTILYHYQAHHSNEKFLCERCNVKFFSRRQHLIRHEKTCQRTFDKRQDPKYKFIC